MANTAPLLTIAIPTFNRASFLALTLDQLKLEMTTVNAQTVEILVSDNCSSDNTAAVIDAKRTSSFPIRSIRNDENVGSDMNIAQCYNLALGHYVLILGDDDLLTDGTLAILCAVLESGRYGVVCLRPYGYNTDFRREHPGGAESRRSFDNAGKFLAAIGPYMTLISSCVINRQEPAGLDARLFCGGNLVQVHLVMRAALHARSNLMVDDYRVACKRNNSGGYDFSQVFVEEFGRVLDSGQPFGLSTKAIRRIETRMLAAYYPTYLLRQRQQQSGDLAATRARFDKRFGDRNLYRFWVDPILRLPRPLAIGWGLFATFFGRVYNGDLRRGLTFASNRLTSGAASRGRSL